VGCYIRYSEEGPGLAAALPRPLLTVSNVTTDPSAASVSITVLLYNGPFLCGFNVPVKGLAFDCDTLWGIKNVAAIFCK